MHNIQIAEKILYPLAEQIAPDGTSPIALIHQWLHAISNNTNLFSENKKIDKLKIKQKLLRSGVEPSSLFRKTNHAYTPNNFTFIDLFAGIGGMHLGFQSAGGVCVFASEFERNAQNTYLDNHQQLPFGDITKINENDIPDHDVLIAGFPCQPFSHAGLKLGIDDTRGTLFHDIARILVAKKPKFALLENVKGLVSHDRGYTLQVILKTLTQIGYSCIIPKEIIEHGNKKEIQELAKKMILKSTDFGVPQNRQRIYIVLWRDDLNIDFEYPKATNIPTRVGNILEKTPDSKLTISDKLWEGHQRRKEQNKANGKGFGYGLFDADSPYTNTISARYYKDGSEILIAQSGKNPRKLSPAEAARLQGFPKHFILNKSNTQAYTQFGNSVSVPVISALANQIANYL